MATAKYFNPTTNQWEELSASKLETPRNINGVPFDGSSDITIPTGGGGTSNYADLTNKPQINGIELNGNKSLLDLSIEPKRGADDLYITNAERYDGGLATGNATLATVNEVADKAEKSVPLVTANTFSALPAITTASLVLVKSDETNDNQPTYYFHDGIKLNWIITQEA